MHELIVEWIPRQYVFGRFLLTPSLTSTELLLMTLPFDCWVLPTLTLLLGQSSLVPPPVLTPVGCVGHGIYRASSVLEGERMARSPLARRLGSGRCKRAC